jgi:NAD(P)-dependent dehydrogenase (short-subunit alcohol dehydrogenase family)
MKHEIRQMLKNGGGAIVNQSSITGSLTGNPGESLYAATKGGVDGITKSAPLEVAKNNIMGAPSRTKRISCLANFRDRALRKAWKHAVSDLGMIR